MTKNAAIQAVKKIIDESRQARAGGQIFDQCLRQIMDGLIDCEQINGKNKDKIISLIVIFANMDPSSNNRVMRFMLESKKYDIPGMLLSRTGVKDAKSSGLFEQIGFDFIEQEVMDVINETNY